MTANLNGDYSERSSINGLRWYRFPQGENMEKTRMMLKCGLQRESQIQEESPLDANV